MTKVSAYSLVYSRLLMTSKDPRIRSKKRNRGVRRLVCTTEPDGLNNYTSYVVSENTFCPTSIRIYKILK